MGKSVHLVRCSFVLFSIPPMHFGHFSTAEMCSISVFLLHLKQISANLCKLWNLFVCLRGCYLDSRSIGWQAQADRKPEVKTTRKSVRTISIPAGHNEWRCYFFPAYLPWWRTRLAVCERYFRATLHGCDVCLWCISAWIKMPPFFNNDQRHSSERYGQFGWNDKLVMTCTVSKRILFAFEQLDSSNMFAISSKWSDSLA